MAGAKAPPPAVPDVEARPFRMLIDLREERQKARGVDAGPLLKRYLKEIAVLIAAIDRPEN